MSASRRLLLASVIAIGGTLLGLVLGAGQVMACLGPLNVTAVRCAAHSGARPIEGAWLGMVVASVAIAVLVAIGRPRASWLDGLLSVVGAAAGAALYFARRPIALEGPDYDGTWLTIPLLISTWALLFLVLGGALTGLAMASVIRTLDQARSRAAGT